MGYMHNIYQDKRPDILLISVRANVRKKMHLAQERIEFTVRKSSGLSGQEGKLCGRGQVHGIGRFVYLFFSVLSRVRGPETRVLSLSAVSDPMSN